MSLSHIPIIFYTKYQKSAWHVSCIVSADSPNIHSLHTNIHNNLLALEWNIVNNLVSVTSIILLTQYFWVQEVHTTGLFFINIIVKDVMISINNADQNNQRRHDLKELCYWNHHQSNVTSLTHWGRVTHICVSKQTIIGSDNGLSPGRRQAIIWTNAGKLLFGPPGTNFSEILIEIHTFSLKKMHLKMSSAKRRPFCLGFNVLKWSKKSFIQDLNKNKELNMLKSQIQHNWSLKKEWRIK